MRMGPGRRLARAWVLATAALAVGAAAPAARADVLTISVDGGWSVKVLLPERIDMAAIPAAGRFLSRGEGERFTVSLSVAPPTCEGGTSPSAAYRCMRPFLTTMPGIVQETISLETRGRNAQASYIQYVPEGGFWVKVMHTHVFFEKNGLWGEFHASIPKPTMLEAAAMFAIGDTLEVREGL